MSDRIPMTRSGYDKLKAEVDELETVEMPKLAQRVAAARSEGDLSENAEYHGARESQGMMQAKINVLRDKLARAVIVVRPKESTGEVVFGATIRVKDLKFGDEEEYVLSVGSSFLQDALKHEEVDRYNTYITEKERIVELKLDATTINYKDCLVDSYRGVEDPFGTEIQDLQYAQNPIDPSQVIREPIFKKDALSDGQAI